MGDAQLDVLIDEALRGNPDLALAQARVRQAAVGRAQANEAGQQAALFEVAVVAPIAGPILAGWVTDITDRGHPIVNLRIFRHRNFTVGTLA